MQGGRALKTSPPRVLSGTADGGAQDGWIDGGEIEEERRGEEGRGGVIQEESATVGLIRDESFVSGLIFSSEVVSWPSLCSLRRSVRRSVAAAAANSPIYSGLGHFN